MQLHPPVTEADARTWLRAQVSMLALESPPDDLDAAIASMAEAMAEISSIVLPDELEPLFP